MSDVPSPSLRKQVKDLTFDIERSIRYHSRRQAYFEMFDAVVNTTNLILGSGAVVALVAGRVQDWFIGSLSALVAAISFVNLTMRSSEKASLHSQLKQRHVELLKRIKRLDPDLESTRPAFNKCTEKRLDIERDEPPIYQMVDILAHNEQVHAQGGGEESLWHVSAWKTFTANLWRYETGSLKTLAQLAKEKADKQKDAL